MSFPPLPTTRVDPTPKVPPVLRRPGGNAKNELFQKYVEAILMEGGLLGVSLRSVLRDRGTRKFGCQCPNLDLGPRESDFRKSIVDSDPGVQPGP